MKTKLTLLFLFLLCFQIGKSQFTVSVLGFTLCQGDFVNFTSTSSPTAITSWYWDFGDGDTSTLQNPTHLYNTPGIYTFTLIASDGVSVDTATNTATVNPIPLVSFGYTMSGGLTANFTDSSTIFVLTTDSIIAWSWNFGNGNTSAQQNPSYTYGFPPDSCYDISLAVYSNIGCISILTKAGLICITTVKELNTKNIKIYPIPIIGNQFNITGELNDLENIVGYDILGNEISIPIVSKNNTEIILETTQLKKGNYILKLLFENEAPITKKIIVQ